MNENQQKKRLTEPDPAWQQAYVDGKVKPPLRSFPMRLWCALENVVDEKLHPRRLASAEDMLACVELLVDTSCPDQAAAVIGCGPSPDVVLDLTKQGYSVTGVEPVAAALELARVHVKGSTARIMQGTAEHTALSDNSQALVLMENVLEHVDSVTASLSEAYRIMAPGGVLFVRTTNRQRISLTGINWEFKTRFYHWFPKLVKESYVFDQLHYRPELANYSPRPAVHWFTFAELCEVGRNAGFSRFYSPYDLLYLIRAERSESIISRMRHWVHRNPWLRALAVSQMVGDIFMWKRNDD